MLPSQMKWNFTYQENGDEIPSTDSANIVDQLLQNRGITDAVDVDKFLNPKLTDLHQAELLTDLAKVKTRVDQAIEQGESILIFGDYDADGVTATTILVETLNELGAMCDYYIPNRFDEGYGPNPEAFQQAKRQGFDVIITVDTGIAAVESATVAKELGIDLIITDHHEAQAEMPDAYAIIHPGLSEDYPFKDLAGVGVAFKVAHYLLGYFPKQFLDLVAIGTVADLVPLVNENRILVKYGLEAIEQTQRPGLRSLKEVASIKGPVDEEDIGFRIGPRLNAVGRLGSAYPAVELLLTDDPEEAKRLATEINSINQERQEIVTQIAEEAIEIVEQTKDDNESVIVVAKEGWNEGVLGIVASRLVRTYQRPTICLTLKPDEKIAKGSGRSITAFDLFSNGLEIQDQFLKFGGHSQAIGLTLDIDAVDDVRQSLNQLADEKLKPDDYQEQIDIDLPIDINKLELETITQIEKLAPFGMANPKPKFYVKGNPTDIKQIGAQKNHLKFSLEEQSAKLATIGFGFGDHVNRMTSHDELEAVGHLQINEWNGNRTIQFVVDDLRIDSKQLFDYRGSKFWVKQLSHLRDRSSLFISFQKQTQINDIELIAFDQLDLQSDFDVEDLAIVDLPTNLTDLEELLKAVDPNNIYVCYNLNGQKDWTAFPSRDDFKWFYGFLMQRKTYHHQRQQKIVCQDRGWRPEKIEFIINVFYELKFVKVEEGVTSLIEQVEKKDLSESNFYLKGLKQKEIQEKLYYSNYKQLKTWFMDLLKEAMD